MCRGAFLDKHDPHRLRYSSIVHRRLLLPGACCLRACFTAICMDHKTRNHLVVWILFSRVIRTRMLVPQPGGGTGVTEVQT